MPTARIITHNQESTAGLAAYLRAEGYDVVHASPENPQARRGELIIAIDACPSPTEALARALELAASRGCDVFVGDGIVEQLDFTELEAPPAEAESLNPESEAQGEFIAERAADDFAVVPPETSSQIPDFVEKEISGPPAIENSPRGETVSPEISGHPAPDSGSSDPPTYSEAACAEVAARSPRPIPLGSRALRGAGDLLRLRVRILVERARSSSRMLGIRASARLEQVLLGQQLRAQLLAKRLEEQRQIADERRQRAIQNAARATEEARTSLRHELGDAQPDRFGNTMLRIIRTNVELAARWIVARVSRKEPVADYGRRITPISPSEKRAGAETVRDWRMVLAGAGVAALLILFVLGVFTRRAPAADEIRAAEKALQVSTTARPIAGGGISPAEVAPAPAAVIIPPAKSAQAAPPETTVARPGVSRLGAPRPQYHRPSGPRSTAAAETEQEVIVRHFHRGGTHPAAKVVAGVKHYSDLD
jgi:hypothetical protein